MESQRDGRLPVRLGVVFGALVGLGLTLPFAVAFQEAYGTGGAAGLVPQGASAWLAERGLLGADAAAVYDRYGVAYLAAIGMTTVCVFLLARPIDGGVRVILVGLCVLCAGIFADYAIPNDVVGSIGFLFEEIGFLIVAVGVGLVVRERSRASIGVAATAVTFAFMLAGGALTGHIPGGPGLVVLLGSLVFALLADRRRDDRDRGDLAGTDE